MTSTTCKDCGQEIAQNVEKALDGEYAVVWATDSGEWVCAVTGDEHAPGDYVGERDHQGHPMCGQDFMAGTICSDKPGHDGAHSCVCQECGGDWYNETCTCEKDICVWCGVPWGDERCYNGKDICIDCCVAAGDPCGHDAPLMDPVESLSYAILAINTAQHPNATTGNDLLYLELHAERALSALVDIREWVIAQGEDFPITGLGRGES
jgi:hypothetical protein